MKRNLILNKLDRLAMSDVIRLFLEKLPIKSMKEIRQSHSIYEGVGILYGNEIYIQVKKSVKNNTNVIVRKPGFVFLHPLSNQEDSQLAAHRFIKNIA